VAWACSCAKRKLRCDLREIDRSASVQPSIHDNRSRWGRRLKISSAPPMRTVRSTGFVLCVVRDAKRSLELVSLLRRPAGTAGPRVAPANLEP
jgi:hypothetical protein